MWFNIKCGALYFLVDGFELSQFSVAPKTSRITTFLIFYV